MTNGEFPSGVGACKFEDPELFFPLGTTGPAARQIEEAKAVCRRCDVRDGCLDWALENNQEWGVLGGLTEDERRRIKNRFRPRDTRRAALASRAAGMSIDKSQSTE